jgi:AraC family transcriptional activator FtrA
VADLAARAGLARRTFARRFAAEVGTSPGSWLHDQRMALAQRLLADTTLPVEEVARRCGYGSSASLREHFSRRVRTTPTAYRRSFRNAR